MTNTDTSEAGTSGAGPLPSIIKRIVSLVGGGTLMIFSLGVVAGYTKAALAKGTLGWKAAVVFTIAGALFACGLWLVRRSLANRGLARSPKMREYQIVVIATAFFGGIVGMLMQIGSSGDDHNALSGLSYNAPLSPLVSVIILGSLPLLAWLYYRWHKTADEHEQAAYNFGAVLGIYTYFFASVGWWVAWRGGYLPEPNGFAIFWAVIIVWSIGWLWHRFR